MDKITRYQNIVIGLMEEVASKPYANAPEIEQQVIADTQRHHYQLINIGWHRGHFVFRPLLHFDIKDGKIWVQQNDTEIEIGDELVERGVRAKDIVFGFLPAEDRALVKFAAVA